MTIRNRAFQIFLLTLLLIGTGVWLTLFLTLYHPSLEMRSSLIILDSDL
jgi:hypothetical protein